LERKVISFGSYGCFFVGKFKNSENIENLFGIFACKILL